MAFRLTLRECSSRVEKVTTRAVNPGCWCESLQIGKTHELSSFYLIWGFSAIQLENLYV